MSKKVSVAKQYMFCFLVVEGLEKSREPLPALEAIYIMTPTKEVYNLRLL